MLKGVLVLSGGLGRHAEWGFRMSSPLKQNNLQTHQVVLYDRALHPELFPLKGRKALNGGLYEIEVWIMNGAHLLRFEHARQCACELVIAHDRDLPSTGVVTAFLCAGEHEYEHRFEREGVNYITSVQTETLSENQYLATVDEFTGFRGDGEKMAHAWRDEAGPCLSIVDVQQHNREVHAQAFHLVAAARLVLRSQTIFELSRDPKAGS